MVSETATRKAKRTAGADSGADAGDVLRVLFVVVDALGLIIC
jgi:hypothetical protein